MHILPAISSSLSCTTITTESRLAYPFLPSANINVSTLERCSLNALQSWSQFTDTKKNSPKRQPGQRDWIDFVELTTSLMYLLCKPWFSGGPKAMRRCHNTALDVPVADSFVAADTRQISVYPHRSGLPPREAIRGILTFSFQLTAFYLRLLLLLLFLKFFYALVTVLLDCCIDFCLRTFHKSNIYNKNSLRSRVRRNMIRSQQEFIVA